jgi:hypothetical protein
MGVGAGVQVHHVIPFHWCVLLGRPDLELDPRNLITLCEAEAGRPGEDHHLLVGHVDSFRSANLDVEVDAGVTFHGMTGVAIRADARWRAKVAGRMAPLDRMAGEERDALRGVMEVRFPRR